MYDNLVKTIINDYGGTIKPLIISSDLTNGTGLCNPSLFVENDTLHCILRNVEYTLHCSEGEQKFQSFQQGHISYYHRDDINELKVEVSLELIQSLRNVIEVVNERIKWKLEELLPVGVLVKQLDEIIKENKEN